MESSIPHATRLPATFLSARVGRVAKPDLHSPQELQDPGCRKGQQYVRGSSTSQHSQCRISTCATGQEIQDNRTWDRLNAGTQLTLKNRCPIARAEWRGILLGVSPRANNRKTHTSLKWVSSVTTRHRPLAWQSTRHPRTEHLHCRPNVALLHMSLARRGTHHCTTQVSRTERISSTECISS